MSLSARVTRATARLLRSKRGFHRSACCGVKVLGIETSCDDTGAAVVDETGKILVESLRSQQHLHIKFGGIIPPVARDLHAANISKVVDKCLEVVPLSEIDAIAVTNRPGLVLSLDVGVRCAKELCSSGSPNRRIPLIPIHHMEAHALTVRMLDKVEFPYLVLLISGGHSLLAIVESVSDFVLLGETLDDAPGEAFDKVARRLKLKDLPECANMSGGRSLEYLASKGDPQAFEFPFQLSQYRDCMFSFAGLKERAYRLIRVSEADHDVPPDGFIPQLEDFCASFQYSVAKHLCTRVQRAMEYINDTDALGAVKPTLVVSGGVACNSYIREKLQIVCDAMKFDLKVPPPKLCTDNGVMIAWNGMERFLAKTGITTDYESVQISGKAPLGRNETAKVSERQIKCTWIKIK